MKRPRQLKFKSRRGTAVRKMAHKEPQKRKSDALQIKTIYKIQTKRGQKGAKG